MASDLAFNEKLARRVEFLFRRKVDTSAFLAVVDRYDETLLSSTEIKRFRKKLQSQICEDVNIDLLYRMSVHRNWFRTMLNVLCDRELRLEDLAETFISMKHQLDREWRNSRSEPTAMGPFVLGLIGDKGTGKSSTGNSIVGRKIFPVGRENMYTDSSKELQGKTKISETYIDVIDLPHYTDIEKCLDHCFRLNPSGFHAFLFHCRFHENFTNDKLLEPLCLTYKYIFGEDVFKKHGILVVTFGDRFKSKAGRWNVHEWCCNNIGEMYVECRGRVILLDNVTRDPQVGLDQIVCLIDVVRDLASLGPPYTVDDYRRHSR